MTSGMEQIIIYRPDGVALAYKVGDKAMNQPGESALGEVQEITVASSDDGNDYAMVEFENGTKTFGSMPYVLTKTDN